MKNLKDFQENKAVLSVKGGADDAKTSRTAYKATAPTSEKCEDTVSTTYGDNGGDDPREIETGRIVDYYCC